MSEAVKTDIKQELQVQQDRLSQINQQSNGLMSLVERMAVDPDANPDRIEQAFEFYKQVRAMEAKSAYTKALARFKKNPPVVVKDRLNKQYGSGYTSLGNMVNTVNEALGLHDLSANWEIEQSDSIKVTCILTHALGHSENAYMSAPPDKSGSKNPIQEIKSTITYLKLATFEAVTGIASVDGNIDDDGNSASGVIDEETAAWIKKELAELEADVKAFCRLCKCDNVDAMSTKNLKLAKDFIQAKRKEKKRGN